MKKIKLLLLPLLLMVTSVLTVKADEPHFDTLNIIKDVQLSVRHEETTTIIENGTQLSAHDIIAISLDFELDTDSGFDYRGAVSRFTLPDIFVKNTDAMIFDLKVDDVVIAVVTRDANSNDVRIEFQNEDYLINNSVIKGAIKFDLRFDKTQITTEKSYPIEFEGLGNWDVTITPPGPGDVPTEAYVWKGGKFVKDESRIDWEIYIPAFSDLSDVVMTDQHGEGQEIIESSFVVAKARKYIGDVNQGYVDQDMTPTFTSTGGFILNIGDLYYQGYENGPEIPSTPHTVKHDLIRVRYSTRLIQDKEVYSNKVKITANEISRGFAEHDAFLNEGSGTIGGENRSILITKVDKDTQEKLIGAEFTLQYYNRTTHVWENKRTNIAIDSTSGALVRNLKYGTYRLVETRAPEGYELPTVPCDPFVLEKAQPGEHEYLIVVENSKITTPPVIPPVTPPVTPPEDPSEPSIPSPEETPPKPVKPNQVLPSTGMASDNTVLWAGGLLLIGGAILVARRIFKDKK